MSFGCAPSALGINLSSSNKNPSGFGIIAELTSIESIICCVSTSNEVVAESRSDNSFSNESDSL